MNTCILSAKERLFNVTSVLHSLVQNKRGWRTLGFQSFSFLSGYRQGLWIGRQGFVEKQLKKSGPGKARLPWRVSWPIPWTHITPQSPHLSQKWQVGTQETPAQWLSSDKLGHPPAEVRSCQETWGKSCEQDTGALFPLPSGLQGPLPVCSSEVLSRGCPASPGSLRQCLDQGGGVLNPLRCTGRSHVKAWRGPKSQHCSAQAEEPCSTAKLCPMHFILLF